MPVNRARYLRELYEKLICQHCGKPQSISNQQHQVILHHPNCDGDLGCVGNIYADDPNWMARIDAEVARCVPLCRSCHGKEHERMRAA
jgi:hypothetical protein